jgi:hypothetical protein
MTYTLELRDIYFKAGNIYFLLNFILSILTKHNQNATQCLSLLRIEILLGVNAAVLQIVEHSMYRLNII